MNPVPGRKLSLFNRAFGTITILGVFYLNIAEIAQVSCLRLNLPRPYLLAELFNMVTVWSTYTEWNSGVEAEAVAVGKFDENGEPQWMTIDLRPYLPSLPEDANRLLIFDVDVDANGETDQGSREKHEQDYARIVDVLEHCHNRAHPEMPVEQMRLFHVWWPSSRFGYFHLYDQRSRRLLNAGSR